jgi:uncharacterized protein YkwD
MRRMAPAALTCRLCRPPPRTPFSPAGSSWAGAVLAKHNQLRARHGAAPLSWDSSLASGAQSWSDAGATSHSGGAYGAHMRA